MLGIVATPPAKNRGFAVDTPRSACYLLESARNYAQSHRLGWQVRSRKEVTRWAIGFA